MAITINVRGVSVKATSMWITMRKNRLSKQRFRGRMVGFESSRAYCCSVTDWNVQCCERA